MLPFGNGPGAERFAQIECRRTSHDEAKVLNLTAHADASNSHWSWRFTLPAIGQNYRISQFVAKWRDTRHTTLHQQTFHYPTDPSSEIATNCWASIANSIGRACSTSLQNPFTTSATASSSSMPRWRQ